VTTIYRDNIGYSIGRKQVFIPYNGKIADITEADTSKHYLTLANDAGTGAIAGETRKIIAICLAASRISGTGDFYVYPNEGTRYLDIGTSAVTYGRGFIVIADGTQRLQYSQSVANDDWDLYCLGYIVEV
jgi:hypothetical protein